jgi:nitrogen fixation NifU-like protein
MCAAGEPLHELDIAFHEIVSRQFLPLRPGDLREVQVLWLARKFGHTKKGEARQPPRAVLKSVVLDLRADLRLDPQFFTKFARQCLAQSFALLHFATWELPFERVAASRLALPDQDQPISFNHRRHHFHHLRVRIHLAIIEARMHSERLLDHFQNPRNPGELAPPAVKVDVTNPACGDMLRLSARFENGRVAEARFLTRGCTASIAASSALTEWMAGKSPEELAALNASVIEEAVGGLEPASKHAAMLCVDGVRRLLAQLRENRSQ